MRRALLIAILAVLIADASGITALVVREPCSVSATESGSDTGCPAFCVRCSCACCAYPVVPMPPLAVAVVPVPTTSMTLSSLTALPTGISLDILHVPKPLLA